MEKQEFILCAAIWYKDLTTSIRNPVNIPHGIVVLGHRHPDCISTVLCLTGRRTVELADDGVGKTMQGFLTNTNRFVSRKEAAIIAINSKQISKLNYSDDTLYSEDLY